MRLIVLSGHERKMTKVMFNHDDDLVFTSAADNCIMVWDTSTGERLGTYDGHGGAVFDFDIDYQSKYLISGSGDSSVRLWNVNNGNSLYTFKTKARVLSVNFNCGDSLFLAASPQFLTQKAVIHIYQNPIMTQSTTVSDQKQSDNDNDKQLKPLKSISITNQNTLKDFQITKAVWSPLNDQIFAMCSDCTIRVIDVEKGKQIKRVIFDKNVASKMKLDKEIAKNITDFRYCNDYCTAMISSRSKQCKMYDIHKWEPILTYDSDRALNTVAIHPKLDLIAIGGGRTAQEAALSGQQGNYEAQFYHKIYQQIIGTIETDCFSPLNSMDWNSDGSQLIMGYEEGQARLFSMDPDFDKQFGKRSKQFIEVDDVDDDSDSDDDDF